MKCRLFTVGLRRWFADLGRIVSLVCLLALHGAAAELVTLAPETWDGYAPAGKEVDCIYGDFVLRNEQLVVVVAKPVAGRNANMGVKAVSGCIIDLTRRDAMNDQLSAYYPGGARFAFTKTDATAFFVDGLRSESSAPTVKLSGKSVTLECRSASEPGKPDAVVRYTVTDSQPYVWIETDYINNTGKPLTEELADSIRADKVFEFGADAKTHLFWAHDDWFRQSYGVIAEGYDIKRDKLLQLVKDGKSEATLGKGEKLTIVRRIFPGHSLLDVRAIANRTAVAAGQKPVVQHPVIISVTDPAGGVSHAKVTVIGGETVYGSGRTTADGKLAFDLPPGDYSLQIAALGRSPVTQKISVAAETEVGVKLEACGYVVAKITDRNGGPIPCKVAFLDVKHRSAELPKDKAGKYDAQAVNPYFGPDSADTSVFNLRYSHDGQFRQEIGPGRYAVIVSYGPEYDAVFTELDVVRGQETRLEAKLVRTVNTAGWISADFHSHSTPSGDNVSSQLGRVQNLLCEHIEFAPCTEHNRIDSYVPLLKRLGVEHLMATCTGIELTGLPLPVNHQNAFPLIHKPRTQDGGGPTTDVNPVVQIERLAMWDNKSDKLVQGNHPNLPQILGDKDLDGKPDGGFAKMLGYMDVIEVHPPSGIFSFPTAPKDAKDVAKKTNPIFHWLQLLNLGYRITGVVNTDAHYTFHDSGWLRNYLKSPTDDPAKIDTMEMVHVAEHGQIVMTNGPFLEVSYNTLDAKTKRPSVVFPGDSAVPTEGKGFLKIRVQCPNWFDVNRVQVFLNGRPMPNLNFTRREQPSQFSDKVLKFDTELSLNLKTDTHVVVATAGEGLTLGAVMGPTRGKEMPVAVSNPIFLDVDGNGFQANGDLLDYPLPIDPKQHPHHHHHD